MSLSCHRGSSCRRRFHPAQSTGGTLHWPKRVAQRSRRPAPIRRCAPPNSTMSELRGIHYRRLGHESRWRRRAAHEHQPHATQSRFHPKCLVVEYHSHPFRDTRCMTWDPARRDRWHAGSAQRKRAPCSRPLRGNASNLPSAGGAPMVAYHGTHYSSLDQDRRGHPRDVLVRRSGAPHR